MFLNKPLKINSCFKFIQFSLLWAVTFSVLFRGSVCQCNQRRGKKFPTVQTRKKLNLEILQKVPVCAAQVEFVPSYNVCTAPRIVEKEDSWFSQMADLTSLSFSITKLCTASTASCLE